MHADVPQDTRRTSWRTVSVAKATGDDRLHLRVSITGAPSVRCQTARALTHGRKLVEMSRHDTSYSTIKFYSVHKYMDGS